MKDVIVVRRMFEALDCKVVKLKRERYAFLEVGSLRPGDARIDTMR